MLDVNQYTHCVVRSLLPTLTRARFRVVCCAIIMVDPLKPFKEVLGLLRAGDEPPKRKRLGRDSREEVCDKIHVYAIFYGQVSTHRRRVMLDKDVRLGELQQRLDPSATQQHLLDEHDFRFCDSDLSEPLWRFSESCALRVHFNHYDGSGTRMLPGANSGFASSVVGATSDAAGAVAGAVADRVSSLANAPSLLLEASSNVASSAKGVVLAYTTTASPSPAATTDTTSGSTSEQA